jgi:hypothetical protein
MSSLHAAQLTLASLAILAEPDAADLVVKLISAARKYAATSPRWAAPPGSGPRDSSLHLRSGVGFDVFPALKGGDSGLRGSCCVPGGFLFQRRLRGRNPG